MLIQEELKNSLEYVSGVSAYPNNIPASADLPAIVYKNTGFRRNTDSSLCKSDIIDRDFQVFVISKSASETYKIAEKIMSELENYSGEFVESNVLMIRIENNQSLYNYQQDTHEETINIKIIVRK